MAWLFTTEGGSSEVQPAGKRWTLDELQAHVGGYIELAPSIAPGWTLVIDEEGKLKGKPINQRATVLYVNGGADPIVGDALYLKSKEID